jgi:hypothetical protein
MRNTLDVDTQLNSSSQDLSIYVRPEIRKGCAWDINLKFSTEILTKEKIEQIFIEKPRGMAGRTMPYLCIKVRSKMIKPVLELPFTKVGSIIQESDFIECNDSGTAILRVKFTSRPRAVFHKHSDVMILMVALRRGNETICSSNKELIFRGGTGSIHSAEGRNGGLQAKKRKVEQGLVSESSEPVWNTPSLPMMPITPAPLTAYPTPISIPAIKEQHTHTHTHTHTLPEHMPIDNPTPVFTEPKIESTSSMAWPPTDDFADFGNATDLYTDSVINSYTAENYLFETPEVVDVPQYTIVFGKRRGSCKKCGSECSFYRGPGGPCNECGCFPSQHIDLDKQPPSS